MLIPQEGAFCSVSGDLIADIQGYYYEYSSNFKHIGVMRAA
jgi:hypothetical protein